MDDKLEQIRLETERSVYRNRIELEYNSLRKDNRFKTHKNGKKLFLEWRLGKLNDEEAAQVIGNTPSALRMVRSRLTNSKKKPIIDKVSKQFLREVQQQHLDQAHETAQKVLASDEEFKVEVLSEIEIDMDQKQSKNIFVKGDIYDLLGVNPDEVDLITVALMTHKRIAFDFFGMFNRAKVKAMASATHRSIEWMNTARALGKEMRPFLLDIIDKYGTLEQGAIVDVAKANEEKLKVIVDYIIAKYPQDMLELMTLFNTIGGDEEIPHDRQLQSSNGG